MMSDKRRDEIERKDNQAEWKPPQVLAQDETGKWGKASVFDLDTESFNVLLMWRLCRNDPNAEADKGEEITLRTMPGFRFDD